VTVQREQWWQKRATVGLSARRFPWVKLLVLWIALSACLTIFYWQMAVTLNFDDPDDFLRLQQIRDYVGGQSWFDLTQRRIAPPQGLAMHWSRLVDIPVLAFLLPLTPWLGPHDAEIVAVIGAPLLTLLALIIAVVAMTRRLLGPDVATSLLACVLTMSAPFIFLQIHPARIDHHGWQIAFGAAAVAALVQRKARLSGIGAGIALALYLNISIEGAPFVAAAIGIVGLLWALDRDDGVRLTGTLWALLATTLLASILTVPYYRWTEALCDAVMPSHMAAMAVAAAGTALVVRYGPARGAVGRLTLLAAVFGMSLAVFGMAAPTCLGSPFGNLDPVINTFWYQNVGEGMPVWRQDPVNAASMIGFPLVVAGGTVIGYRRASSPEMRRRWTIILFMLVVTVVTGMLVRRASGIAHVLAVPGALVLVGMIVHYADQHFAVVLRAVASATAILVFSPIMPIYAVASFMPPPKIAPKSNVPVNDCERLCALRKLSALPAESILAGIDLGPMVIATTPHSVYGTGYHRMQAPLRETILFFLGSPEEGRVMMRAKGFRHILVAPGSGDTGLFLKRAPNGMMARLVNGPVPSWLVEEDLGSPSLRLYRVRD
jgi:hypothetical protein